MNKKRQEMKKPTQKFRHTICSATHRKRESEVKHLLWMGSGPLGTFLSLSWKGSSALKSSRDLLISSSSPVNNILLPPIATQPIAVVDGFSATTPNDIKTRTPNNMAAAAAARLPDPAGLLIVPTGYALFAAARHFLPPSPLILLMEVDRWS
jgi:hypothetical protein